MDTDGTFSVIDWDTASRFLRSSPIGTDTFDIDGRYPGSGTHFYLLTAGQLLLVVYQLRTPEPGFHDFEDTVSKLGRGWWADSSSKSSTSTKEERMMKKVFHAWMRDQPEVVRDVAAACGEVKRMQVGDSKHSWTIWTGCREG